MKQRQLIKVFEHMEDNQCIGVGDKYVVQLPRGVHNILGNKIIVGGISDNQICITDLGVLPEYLDIDFIGTMGETGSKYIKDAFTTCSVKQFISGNEGVYKVDVTAIANSEFGGLCLVYNFKNSKKAFRELVGDMQVCGINVLPNYEDTVYYLADTLLSAKQLESEVRKAVKSKFEVVKLNKELSKGVIKAVISNLDELSLKIASGDKKGALSHLFDLQTKLEQGESI